MKKGSRLKKFGDIIFLIGVVVFVAALICGKFVEEFDALTVNIIMGVGLIFEAIGVAISFRTDRIEQVDEKKSAEDKVLEEVKNDIPEEEVEGIVEADVTTIKEEPAVKEEVKPKKETTKKTQTKKQPAKKSNAKKTSAAKKSTGTKKSTTTKKTTTKKKTTKKTNTTKKNNK